MEGPSNIQEAACLVAGSIAALEDLPKVNLPRPQLQASIIALRVALSILEREEQEQRES